LVYFTAIGNIWPLGTFCVHLIYFPHFSILYQEKSGNPAVNIYNGTSSLVRFENKHIFFCFERRSSLQQRWRCSCKFLSRRIGSWLVEFSPILGLFTLCKFWKNYRSSPNFRTTFIPCKSYAFISTKKNVGLHFGRFFDKLISLAIS
jgi:hypothetical protein